MNKRPGKNPVFELNFLVTLYFDKLLNLESKRFFKRFFNNRQNRYFWFKNRLLTKKNTNTSQNRFKLEHLFFIKEKNFQSNSMVVVLMKKVKVNLEGL